MKVKIDGLKPHPFNKRVFKDLSTEKFEAFKRDISLRGLKYPLEITPDNIIICGHQRWKAVKELGWEEVEVKILKGWTDDQLLEHMIKDNLLRRQLDEFEQVDCGKKLEEIYKGRQGGDRQTEDAKALRTNDLNGQLKGQTRDLVAQDLGLGNGKTWERLKEKVTTVRKYSPTIEKEIKDGKTNIKTVLREIKEDQREKEREEDEERVKTIGTPEEVFKHIKFSTIVIDPPWDWGDEGDINQLGRAKPDYATIPFDDLKKLPISNLTKGDAHIYLWITNRSLQKGFELLESWGFRYITCLTWCKPSFGMGNYFRGSTEQILFGVKGSLPLKRKDVGTWFSAVRGDGGHSSKPDAFYKMVESCSPGLYLDYFGRKKRDGWHVYGNGAVDDFIPTA